ncbi:MAG TPA: FAD-dependent oxidoreductase [Streptosporangiaceae bacterium]|nr:FAD-dependent oxidoreductase [Streptosporangiaceae bacterium]
MNEPLRAGAAPWARRGSVFSQAGLARPVAATPHDLDQLRASHGRRRPGNPLVPTSVASPRLAHELFGRLLSYGTPQKIERGDVLFRPGDEDADLIVVAGGSVEVVRTATANVPAATVAVVDAGGFVGELNLLTGQNVYLLCRAREAGTIYRVSPVRLRQLMATDVELSDIVFKALIARRELLQRSAAALAVEIVGGARSAAALALRTYAGRQRLIHLWFDADTPAGRAMMESSGLTEDDLPAVVMPGTTLKQATPGGLAEKLGLSYRRSSTKPVDVTIVGAGPAGLAAAVYGASEGLDTVLLDAVGTGGQAAASSRIENYFGFPFGLAGADLTGRAVLQALKFGAQLASPCEAVKLDTDRNGSLLRLHLHGGEVIDTKAVVIATGARYRVLPLERWPDFEGAGIYYAATELEARGCAGSPVTVVGGANSAGQAALYLAGQGSTVSLVVRGPEIEAEMSAYLVDRLRAHPRVTVRCRSEVTRLDGDDFLEEVSITDRAAGSTQAQPCSGLFCFIGAEPATSWLTGIATGGDGFIRTDVQLTDDDLGPAWATLSRRPLPFETSIPGVFAVGDVHAGSMKRVAAATGEGASAIASVHKAISTLV